MKAGTETALYNQGYMDGFDDAEKDKDTPDYWDNSEPEYQKHPKTDEWVEKGKEWLKSKKEEQI